ncbi:MAG TPA: FtsX-like permease family protein, partial [Ktedonobacteraceae bacterium]|nr:FtsX-like permease family protein [Ktedonobacteraceae bacterium]
TPADGTIASLLTGDGAIIDQKIADTYHKQVGDTLEVHVTQDQRTAQILPVHVTGIVTDSGVLAQESGVILIAQAAYQQIVPQSPVTFGTVEITTANQTQTDAAVNEIKNNYPLATTQTAADALKSTEDASSVVKKFLEIAGLLALLIGGVGIVNTMQVLLSRRKIEIAMLKTTGYRRVDLYLLFGLEAGLLGLIGGVIGSAVAIGVSYIVRNVVQQVFSLVIPFSLDWSVIGGGVLIGLSTALIFGLLPIVQAANIRPLSVIRELPESRRAGSFALTVLLLFILSLLFCVMSVIILNDAALAIETVYGTFIFLIILSGFFALVTLLVSSLPVPERFNIKFLALIIGCGIVSGLIALVLPIFGYLLLALTTLGFLTVLMPRTWKANVRIALRNIGRHYVRTTTTLLAIFVGVFAIGLTLVIGLNVRATIDNAISNVLPFNIIATASGSEADALHSQIQSLPGLRDSTQSYTASFVVQSIDGQSLAQIAQQGSGGSGNEGRNAFILNTLNNMQGFDIANGDVPSAQKGVVITAGRTLNASDAGTNNVLIPAFLVGQEPFKDLLKVGSTIVVTSIDGKSQETLNVVGIYRSTNLSSLGQGGLYGTKDNVAKLSPNGQIVSIFTLKIDPNQVDTALSKIGQIAPHSVSISLADLGGFIEQFLSDIILVVVVISSLSLLAGIVIIANAVALAMLERRRELGILKSVGYTSRTVLGEVLIENAVVGGLGALLAMLLVTFISTILGRLAFNSDFSVTSLITVSLIGGSALLATLTALLVAWGSVRVRPLTVLRYE